MLGTNAAQQIGLLLIADDIHKVHPVLEADLVQHLAQIGRRRRMHQGLVALEPHGRNHAQRRQRIDKARGRLRRGRAIGQHQTVTDPHAAILGIHGPAQNPDRLAQQGLGCWRRSGRNDNAAALITDRHGLVHPRRHGPHQAFWHLGHHGRCSGGSALNGCGHVGCAQKQTQIRRIDRCRLNPHQNLVGAGGWGIDLRQRQLKLAALGDQGAKLQTGGRNRCGHEAFPYKGCCLLRLNLVGQLYRPAR